VREYRIKILNGIKQYHGITIIFVLSLLLFACAARYNAIFVQLMSVTTFLTWHSIFEFLSILAAFSIFIVSYYTYEESANVRMILLGCAFLAMGTLDTFHFFSYKGMANFFIPNTSSNRATTFWVLARLIGSIQIAAAEFIPLKHKSDLKKSIFVVPTVLTVLVLFILVTYYPQYFPAMYIEGMGLTPIKIILEYVVICFLMATFIKVSLDYKRTSSTQEYLFIIGLLLFIFSEVAFVSYASVYDAYNYLGHIYKIIAYFIMFKAIYTDNVRMPYREMKKAKNQLSEYSKGLNDLVKQRTKELEKINGKLLQDLEYAKEMQQSLLPIKMPHDMMVSFDAVYLPAEHLSGDFYNVVKLDDNNIAIYIGDVAGHGVSAAMLTVFAYQNIKSLKETDDCENEINAPGFVINSLYKAFNKTNFKEETYIVMLYGIYNINERCFTYASGGINVPPLIIKHSGEIKEMEVSGFPICKLGKVISPHFEERVIKLEPEDKILFYTDGLVEAENSKGIRYTEENLFEIIRKNHALRRSDFCKAIENDFFKYMEHRGNPKDDVTLLVMDVN